jgi:predicted nucleotidyltransferase
MHGGQVQFINDLARQLCQESVVAFAVVFGSASTGRTHPSSDIDIAVKFTESLSSEERFRKRCFLSGSLQQPGQPFVDVSDAAELPLPVAHDAVNGTLLCGDKQAFHHFKTGIEAEFEEHQTEIQRHSTDVITRIAERGLHG